MADMVCSKCNVGWQILDQDRYCGYCGCEAFGFSVNWKDKPLYFKGDRTDIHELTILVENAGATPITFQPIQIQNGNALTPTEKDKTFTVKPGKIYTTEVQVDPDKLKTEYPEKITVSAVNVFPNQDGIKSIELQTLPIPEFTLKPESITLEYPKSKETVPVVFNIESQQNTLHIENIESSHRLINNADLSGAPDTVRLEINCRHLEEGNNSDTLRFKLRGPSKPVEKQIHIQAKRLPEPARLFVPETHLEIIQDRERTHTLRLENRGEDPLEINEIILADTSGLVQLPDLDSTVIEGGKKRELDISVSSIDVEPGTRPIKLTILSNCATAPKYQYTLNVNVKEREIYPHYLAIDFGTTNSCCAYIDENDQYKLKLIPLEDRKTDVSENPIIFDLNIMPSSIIYRVKPENGRDYDVGSKAETDRTDGRDGPYYISSVKRWLGYVWHRQFPNKKEFQPTDVVSHILKHIINKAEDYLEQQNLPSKVTRCVVTHPTKFNQQQQEALRQAFENIGITDLILIDEASAASMGTINKYENLPENYRLLVYDFGGGTIDIVLSQVTKKGDDIIIEPIARDGDPKYGGDDVTQAIVDYVISEYRQRIEEISPEQKFDIPYFGLGQALQTSGNTDTDDAARNNSTILYRRAEEMKRDLGTQPETEFSFIDLNVVEHGVTTTLTEFIQKINKKYIQDENVLMEHTHEIVRVKLTATQFERYIQRALHNTFAMIDTMIADTGDRLPDLVVLAGQSSKMRFVKQMMADHFKNKYQKDIEIHLDDNPKTCVVMGAAEYSMPYTVPIIGGDIKTTNLSNKTHTRFGITRFKLGIGPVFGEIIPKGKLIPDESYGSTELPLKSMLVPIKVLEHFGSDNNLDKDKVSPINTFNLELPEDVDIEKLRSAKLEMDVKLNGEIELTAIVGNDKYPFTVQREKPEFVDDINSKDSVIKIEKPQTTPVIKPDKPQTVSPYQQEAEKAIQDTVKQVQDLAHKYHEGEPVNFQNIFPAKPSQKVILILNLITQDLFNWKSELKRSGKTDILKMVTLAETVIKEKLKTIRSDVPSPEPLDTPTDVTTENDLNRVQKECCDYIEKFEATLRSHELNRDIDTTLYKQFILLFIKDHLFNNITRNMLCNALPAELEAYLQHVDLEIIPIEIGETLADSLVHDIQGSKQTDVKRGTIAEVIQPGLMNKNSGTIMQKPIVIRGE